MNRLPKDFQQKSGNPEPPVGKVTVRFHDEVTEIETDGLIVSTMTGTPTDAEGAVNAKPPVVMVAGNHIQAILCLAGLIAAIEHRFGPAALAMAMAHASTLDAGSSVVHERSFEDDPDEGES